MMGMTFWKLIPAVSQDLPGAKDFVHEPALDGPVEYTSRRIDPDEATSWAIGRASAWRRRLAVICTSSDKPCRRREGWEARYRYFRVDACARATIGLTWVN